LGPERKPFNVPARLASSAPAPPQGQPNPGNLIAYDVQSDGSLKNERQFANVGGDGSTVDSQGRIYTTTNVGAVKVVAPDGKVLGDIPTPLGFITVAFSGPDKKTL